MFNRRSLFGLLVVPFLPNVNKSTNDYHEIHYEGNHEISDDGDLLIVHRGSFAYVGVLDKPQIPVPPLVKGFKRISIYFDIKKIGFSSVHVVTWKSVDREVYYDI